MYYKKVMDLQGAYCDALGIVYDVHVARRVRNAQGVNVGYEEFPSLEAALEHWGLVPISLGP